MDQKPYKTYEDQELIKEAENQLGVHLEATEKVAELSTKILSLETERIKQLRSEIEAMQTTLIGLRQEMKEAETELASENDDYRIATEEFHTEQDVAKNALTQLLFAFSEIRVRKVKEGKWEPSNVFLGKWKDQEYYAGQLAFNGYEVTSLQDAVLFSAWLKRRGWFDNIDFQVSFVPVQPLTKTKLHSAINDSLIGDDPAPVDHKVLVLKKSKGADEAIYSVVLEKEVSNE